MPAENSGMQTCTNQEENRVEIAKNSIRAEAGNRLTAGIKTWTPTARYQEKEKKKKRSDKTVGQ
jgi:hypothetical protein